MRRASATMAARTAATGESISVGMQDREDARFPFSSPYDHIGAGREDLPARSNTCTTPCQTVLPSNFSVKGTDCAKRQRQGRELHENNEGGGGIPDSVRNLRGRYRRSSALHQQSLPRSSSSLRARISEPVTVPRINTPSRRSNPPPETVHPLWGALHQGAILHAKHTEPPPSPSWIRIPLSREKLRVSFN